MMPGNAPTRPFMPATGDARIATLRQTDGMQIHRGRLIDHLHLVVADLEASRRFYTAVFGVLGIPITTTDDAHFSCDELYVSTTARSATAELTGRHHLAFQARDHAMVDAFHAAAVAAGGRDHGAPGLRPYHPGYYGAFVLDPDGNNIEAVDHGPASHSASSIVISF